MKYLLIFLGSGTGGLARFALSTATYKLFAATFPVGTLAVNLAGCLLAGFLTGLAGRLTLPPDLRLLLFIGFLGGFTTLSTFGLETFDLINQWKFGSAAANLLLTNLLGVGLVFAGYLLFQGVSKIIR